MTNKGVKLLLLGLTAVLFGLMLVFAGFVFPLLDAAPYLINAGHPIGEEVVGIVLFALIVGIAGLAVALVGLGRTD